MVVSRDVSHDRSRARIGKLVVLASSREEIILLRYSGSEGLYSILVHPCCHNLRKVVQIKEEDIFKWDGEEYSKSHFRVLAALSEDSPEFNWEEVLKIAKESIQTSLT